MSDTHQIADDLSTPPSAVETTDAPIVPPTEGQESAQAVSLGDLLREHDGATALPAGFDPTIHAVDADGQPKRRRDGSYALKRGRKSGSTAQPSANSATPPDTPTEGPTINNREAARQAFALVSGLSARFIGPEWAPEDKAEEKFMVDSIEAYFVARGGAPDLGPGWGLAAAVLVYGMRRTDKPNTREKLGIVWGRVKSTVRGWFKRPHE